MSDTRANPCAPLMSTLQCVDMEHINMPYAPQRTPLCPRCEDDGYVAGYDEPCRDCPQCVCGAPIVTHQGWDDGDWTYDDVWRLMVHVVPYPLGPRMRLYREMRRTRTMLVAPPCQPSHWMEYVCQVSAWEAFTTHLLTHGLGGLGGPSERGGRACEYSR